MFERDPFDCRGPACRDRIPPKMRIGRRSKARIFAGLLGIFIAAAASGGPATGPSGSPGAAATPAAPTASGSSIPTEIRPASTPLNVQSSNPIAPAKAPPQSLLLDASNYGSPPQPTSAVREKFGQWIQQVVDPENNLDLAVGKPRILVLKQAPQKIQIPDEKVASYDVLSEKELSVVGVAVGTTVLNVWFEDKSSPSGKMLLSYFVRVSPDPEAKLRMERIYQALEQQINKAFPDSRVSITMVGENLIVSGQAKDASDADRIIRIIEANSVTADLTTQRGGAGAEAAAGSGAPPAAGGEAAAPSPSEILALARNGIEGHGRPRGASQAVSKGNSRIINMLRVPGENQVMLRVTVAEVNRSAARSIGLNFSLINSKGVQLISNQTGGLGSFTGAATGGNLPMLLDHGQLGIALEALRTLNLAKSLAEPNLVTVNGQTASFQAGGKFPVPVVTGATSTGLQGVQFVPFGVQLDFTPFITEKDAIRLVFNAEVSTRDASSGTTINGANVSGVTTRNVQTTVDMKPGQTLAVAGLIQQNFGSTGNRIPFFGDMPILSSLLGVNQTSTAEQELVILINAELVHPLDAKDVPLLPGHDLLEPSDMEFFLGGRLESRNGPDFRSPTRTDFERLTQYERLQRSYLFGPTGHSDGRTGAETPSDLPTKRDAAPSAVHSQ